MLDVLIVSTFRITFYQFPSLKTDGGLSAALRIVHYGSGARDPGLYSWNCTVIQIQVRYTRALLYVLFAHMVTVLSVDLNAAGSMLATDSGDSQARICACYKFLSRKLL